MNENNPGGAPERDPAFDRLYREAGGEGPPPQLDAAILAAAHREVGSRPQARPGALRRWQVPVSIAAVVVLSVSLVTLVREEGGEQLVQPAPPSRPAAPAAEQAPPVPAPFDEKSADQREPARARASASGPAGIAAEQRRDLPTAASGASGSLARDTEPAGPAVAQQGMGAATSEPASQPQPQSSSGTVPPAERHSGARQAQPAEDVAAPAPAAERAAPAAKAAQPRSMASEARKEAADRPPIWQDYEQSPPEKWLERIGGLKRQGRVADADAMLAEFRRRFPAHPLPPGMP